MSKELGMLLIGFVIGAAVFGIISAIIDAHNTPLIDVKEQKLDSMRITLDLIFKRVLLIEKKLGINKEQEINKQLNSQKLAGYQPKDIRYTAPPKAGSSIVRNNDCLYKNCKKRVKGFIIHNYKHSNGIIRDEIIDFDEDKIIKYNGIGHRDEIIEMIERGEGIPPIPREDKGMPSGLIKERRP